MTVNIGSYSGTLNSKINLEMVQEYNELAVFIATMNVEKEARDKSVVKNKVDEAEGNSKKKSGKEVD